MAEIPDGDRRRAAGSPRRPASLLDASIWTSQTVSQFIPASPLTATDPLLGVGVAAGNLHRRRGARFGRRLELARSTSSSTAPTTDIAPGAADLASCPITLSSQLPNHDKSNRALVVGSLLASGPAIAIGTPGAAAAGERLVLHRHRQRRHLRGRPGGAGGDRHRVRADAGDRRLRRRRGRRPAGRARHPTRVYLYKGPDRAGRGADRDDPRSARERGVRRGAGGDEPGRQAGRRGADRRSGRHASTGRPAPATSPSTRAPNAGDDGDARQCSPITSRARARPTARRSARCRSAPRPLVSRRRRACRWSARRPRSSSIFTLGPTDPRAM